MEKELEKWLEKLRIVHYPRWEELPDLELYMDQVISLIDNYIGFLCSDPKIGIVTNTMINNYVKLKLIPKPKKRRYNRVHLAYLIAILTLKEVLTIREIKNGIQFQANISGTKNAYNYFCEEVELALKEVMSDSVSSKDIDDFSKIPIKLATMSFASKIVASYVISVQERISTNE